MAGVIRSYMKCPACGSNFPSSKGDTPITCIKGCQTQPTKFYIKLKWHGKACSLYYDRKGQTMHSFAHAAAVIGEIRTAIDQKSFDPNIYRKQSGTTFTAFWDRFHRKYRDKPATYDKIRAIGTHHMRYFHNHQMRDIQSWQIDEWWEGLKDKDISPRYRNDCLQWLKRFYNEALALDIVERLPHFPPMDAIPEPDVVDYLTEEEQISLLSNIPEYDRPIFDFLFLTGVRVNEACGLLRSDTDWKKGVTVIQHTVKRDKTIGIVKSKKRRIIPHVPEIKSCLVDSAKLSGFSHKCQFVNRWGRRYHDEYLRETLKKACIKAGVVPMKLKNATRHSFGMALLRKGFDIWQVSKALNHSGIVMTEHYVKMLAEEMDGMYGREKVDKKGTKWGQEK